MAVAAVVAGTLTMEAVVEAVVAAVSIVVVVVVTAVAVAVVPTVAASEISKGRKCRSPEVAWMTSQSIEGSDARECDLQCSPAWIHLAVNTAPVENDAREG